MAKTRRLIPSERREEIITAALEVAEEIGFLKVSRERVAGRAGTSAGLVSHYMGTVGELHERILRRAVQQQNLAVLAQAVSVNHPTVRGSFLDNETRLKVSNFIHEQ